jgi:hypothetical protein
MPRKPRLFIPCATYHVYCRVARGEFIFAHREDSDLFLESTSSPYPVLRDWFDLLRLEGWKSGAWTRFASS